MKYKIIAMGVSASGKSTAGMALAQALSLPFVECDRLHSRHNIEKMSRGEPLTDGDRAPWLRAIAALLTDDACYPRGVVVACSALKAAHRELLRAASPAVRFVFLDASPELISTRADSACVRRDRAHAKRNVMQVSAAAGVAVECDCSAADKADMIPAGSHYCSTSAANDCRHRSRHNEQRDRRMA